MHRVDDPAVRPGADDDSRALVSDAGTGGESVRGGGGGAGQQGSLEGVLGELGIPGGIRCDLGGGDDVGGHSQGFVGAGFHDPRAGDQQDEQDDQDH